MAPGKGEEGEKEAATAPREHDLARFCALAGCLAALLRALAQKAPPDELAAAAGLPARLAGLLIGAHRAAAAAAAADPAEGPDGAEDGKQAAAAAVRHACTAARLALLAVATSAAMEDGATSGAPEEAGSEPSGSDGSSAAAATGGRSAHAAAAWDAASACLALEALPRWHAVQLLRAAAANLEACGRPGQSAARLRQAAAAVWPAVAAAGARLLSAPHADVACSAAAAWLAALRQGAASAVGAAACERLLAEVQELQAQVAVPAAQPQPAEAASGGGAQAAGDSSNGAGGGAGSKASNGTDGVDAAEPAPGGAGPEELLEQQLKRQAARRLVAFDLALLQAWAETGCGAPADAAGAPAAAPLSLPAALAAAASAAALLRAAAAPAAGTPGAAGDSELAAVCVGLLAALTRHACAWQHGPALEAGTPAAGPGPPASGSSDQALQLARAAAGGLEVALAAPGLPAPVCAAALRAVAAAAHDAPGDERGAAVACAAAGMAQAAASSQDAQLRRLAADAALAAARGALACGAAAGPGARAAARRGAALALTLASDEDPGVMAAARAAVGALALPTFILALAPAEAGAPGAPAAAAADSLTPSGREALGLQRQLRGFRPGQLAAAFEDLLQASPGLTLLTKRPGAGGGSGAPDEGACFVDPGLLALARELPPLPAATTAAAGDWAQGAAAAPAAPAAPAADAGPPALDPRDITGAAAAGWYLAQEAARHCVAARMRTHLGGPTEGFASLERMLQGALARLQQAAAPAGGGGGGGPGAAEEDAALRARHGAAHLLEFVTALEAGIHGAAEGCLARPAPPQGVMAFFVANARVGGGLLVGRR
jgi:PI-3-kinase-related kinase SMG-1